ncbi:MAG: glycosyl transferase, partial [Acidobacteriota bacterium]|nr:glycosyl transferase [Acidobacteriota bacterium]
MTFEIAITAVLVSLLSGWLTHRLARSAAASQRLLDHPNERSLHQTPVPRTGGLAILTSLAAGLLIVWAVGRVANLPAAAKTFDRTALWMLGMCVPVAAVSFWDDWVEVGSGVRFLVHLAAACGAVFGANLLIEEIAIPLSASTLFTIPIGWLAAPFAVLWLMWMTNLYNFMDGMDGFAGGMSVCGFGFLSLLAAMNGHPALAAVAL